MRKPRPAEPRESFDRSEQFASTSIRTPNPHYGLRGVNQAASARLIAAGRPEGPALTSIQRDSSDQARAYDIAAIELEQDTETAHTATVLLRIREGDGSRNILTRRRTTISLETQTIVYGVSSEFIVVLRTSSRVRQTRQSARNCFHQLSG
jgi:hypothetical protein